MPRTFHLIHHTHWDREWYLPREAFRARLVEAMRDLLDLLERDAGARFTLDGQTILVDDTLALHPEWRPRFERAVHAGQLEVGPWYVLADELIPSGESLLRNLLIGSQEAQALGARMDVIYSPDAFGHPAILPTLAQEFGIDHLVIWRGHGISGQDRDLYQWRGPDGRAVLLYHLPPSGYEIGAQLGHPGTDLAEHWRRVAVLLTQRAATGHVAVFIGADHHPPIRNPDELTGRIADLEPGHVVRWSGLGDFFDAVHSAQPQMPTVTGELRMSRGHTWALQGVHSTRSRLRRRHGLTELALQRRAEVLHALTTWLCGAPDVTPLRHAWRTLVQCQFHDTLAGTCSDAVAREQDVRLTSIQAIERDVTVRCLDTLSGHDPDCARDAQHASPRLLLWNPAARTRRQITTTTVTAFRADVLVGPPDARLPRRGPGHQPFAMRAEDGTLIPVQVLDVTSSRERVDAARHYPDEDDVDQVRIAFHAPSIGGLSVLPLSMHAADCPCLPDLHALRVTTKQLSNRFIDVRVAGDGAITLVDGPSGEPYTDVLRVIDEGDEGDSYTPSIVADSRATTQWVAPARVIADGPFVAALELGFATWRGARRRIAGRVTLLLHADSPILRVRVDMDNFIGNHRVRIGTRVGCGTEAIAGAAFGFEARLPVSESAPPYPREHPLPTAPAQRYVMAGAGGRGLILLFPGFVEYEWTSAHELLHTVFRSTGDLSRDDVAARPGMAGWTATIPEAQEPGRHVYEFAIATVYGSESQQPAIAEALWEDAFLPVQARFVRNYVGQDTIAGGVALDGDGLVFSALKFAEHGDGVVARCFNPTDAVVRGHWRFAQPITHAKLLRADETPIGCVELLDTHTVTIDVPARSLFSVWVLPKASTR